MPSLLRVTINLFGQHQYQGSGRYTSSPTENAALTPNLLMSPSSIDLAELLVADALSHYAPLKAPEIPLGITINHVHITPYRKTEFQTPIQDDPLSSTPLLRWSLQVGQMISMMSHILYAHTMATETPSQLKVVSPFKVKVLIIPLSKREKILQSIHEGHMGISKCQNSARHCMYWPGINWDIHMPCWIMPQHANVTAHRNHDSCSSQHWPWNAHCNSSVMTTSTLKDLHT